MRKIEIRICVGSSCFARGNGQTLRLLQEYISAHGMEDSVSITGSLCEGLCADGPNIMIDGQRHGEVDESTVLDILRLHI